jgi:hypothetical protein
MFEIQQVMMKIYFMRKKNGIYQNKIVTLRRKTLNNLY